MLKYLPILALLATTACVQSHPPQVTIKPASISVKHPEPVEMAHPDLTWQQALRLIEPAWWETLQRPVLIERTYDWNHANHAWKEHLY
jgi:hypothetical protein